MTRNRKRQLYETESHRVHSSHLTSRRLLRRGDARYTSDRLSDAGDPGGNNRIFLHRPRKAYFFNKKIYEDYSFEYDLYKLVKDGKWTWDKLISMTKQVSVDVNNDSVYNEDDLYGYYGNADLRQYRIILSA